MVKISHFLSHFPFFFLFFFEKDIYFIDHLIASKSDISTWVISGGTSSNHTEKLLHPEALRAKAWATELPLRRV